MALEEGVGGGWVGGSGHECRWENLTGGIEILEGFEEVLGEQACQMGGKEEGWRDAITTRSL